MTLFFVLLSFSLFQAALANPRENCHNALDAIEVQVIQDPKVDQQMRETILNQVTKGFVGNQQNYNNFGSQECLKGVLYCTNIIRYNVRMLSPREKRSCCRNCFVPRRARRRGFSNPFG
ncbi:unnamed protein product [Bursaphelenchus xylophilus]|uniref:(pine wood nematode) hypothetical protein n=1 Tax=Bursaphelenchus xylophilus TaxID=6326 RepID=A0A7I8XHJ9_BURXY|nr:unnamed protein product [Bursaphelenchus xylophilus]CAG9081813.1 unnamed protein product [Bursaphelenchus xylophilus]